MANEVETGAEQLTRSTGFRAVARSGFAASGIVQALVGVIAIRVAVQGGGGQADQSGALESIARAPGGAVLVWLIAVCGIALALQLALDGALVRDPDAKEAWTRRLKAWGKAVVYAAVGVTALRIAIGTGASSSSTSRKGSATVLSLPGGQIVLVIAGLVVIGIGATLVVQGATRRFEKTIRVPAADRGRAVVALGMVGYIARGVAIAVVGVLFVAAAVRTDPNAASGLDGALRAFAGLPFGRVVLVAIGVGWIASGIYSVLRARLARLD